jgi:hypothetical protein
MHESAVPTVSPEWLDALMRAAGLPAATGFVPLGGGTFSAVFRVHTSAGDVVVKVPPDPSGPLMTYEHGITGTEARYYRLAAAHGITSVPRTLYHGRVAGVEALVLSLCPGQPWPEVAELLADEHRRALRRRVGQEVAALHRVVGSGFACPARALQPTWRDAFLDMIAMLVADAGRFDPLPALPLLPHVGRDGAASPRHRPAPAQGLRPGRRHARRPRPGRDRLTPTVLPRPAGGPAGVTVGRGRRR